MIDNTGLRDERLTWKATGLLAYLLSLPDDWRIDGRELAKRKLGGKALVYSGLAELEENGYLVRRQERRDDGTWQHVAYVHEVPVPENPEPDNRTPIPDYRVSDNRERYEGLSDEEGETTSPAGQPETRKRDLLWDAVMDVCGIDTTAITAKARGRYNEAVGQLRKAGATPAEVYERAAAYRLRWPNVSLTPSALASRWPECNGRQPALSNGQAAIARAALRTER